MMSTKLITDQVNEVFDSAFHNLKQVGVLLLLFRGFYKSWQPVKFAIYVKQIVLSSLATFSEINNIRVKIIELLLATNFAVFAVCLIKKLIETPVHYPCILWDIKILNKFISIPSKVIPPLLPEVPCSIS